MSGKHTFTLFLFFCIAACDTAPNDLVGEPGDEFLPFQDSTVLATSEYVAFEYGDLKMSIQNTGAIGNASWTPTGHHFLTDSGIWVAGQQDGQAKASLHMYWSSNMTTVQEDKQLGIFNLHPDQVLNPIKNWYPSFGAPVDMEGKPVVFGERMLWAGFGPRFDRPLEEGYEELMGAPIGGLHIGQSVYVHEGKHFRHVVLIRFELVNNSDEMLRDLHVGYWADFDLSDNAVPARYDYWENAIGYDTERHMSYVYPTYFQELDQPAETPFLVAGFTFLESPISLSGVPVSSHRKVWRNEGPVPGFNQEDLVSPQSVLNSLKGLSATGEAMIDPTTGQQTRFAYAGDPATNVGWVDAPWDSRSLMGAGPFSIGPGDRQVLTVALVVTEGHTVGAALESLGERVDRVRREPAFWQFHLNTLR